MTERSTDEELAELKKLGGVVEAIADELLERRGLVRPACGAAFTVRINFTTHSEVYTLACNLGHDHEGPHGVIER